MLLAVAMALMTLAYAVLAAVRSEAALGPCFAAIGVGYALSIVSVYATVPVYVGNQALETTALGLMYLEVSRQLLR